MPWYADGPSAPPAAGTPSGSSTGYLSGISQQSGIALGQGASPQSTGLDYFPYLYTGVKVNPAIGTVPDPTFKRSRSYSDKHPSVLTVQQHFMDSGNDNIHHWAYLLALAGYRGDMTPAQAAEYSQQASMNGVFDAHLSFLKDAANLYGTGKKITPNDYLKQLLDYRLGPNWNGDVASLTAANAGKLNANAAKTTTQTSRSVDLMSNEDAKGMVRGMLQQELGRDPTQAEYEDFVATLHSAESANPSVSRTTTTTDGSGNSSQKTGTHGGLGQSGTEQVLYDRLRKKPSWGEWQAVGTYAPALYEALGAAVPGA
jgi:hypothetical protein